MTSSETIVALSSGAVPSGVAVVRVSGENLTVLAQRFVRSELKPRVATYTSIKNPVNQEEIDRGLAIWFPGPGSFTGEDCLEFHIHGGRAVVSELINSLCAQPGVRLAEAGEFSRRAFENGKHDLTEIEGIADLIAAETAQQRRQALSQSMGGLRQKYEAWRQNLVRIRALIEAEIDFTDEEDVPSDISEAGFSELNHLITEIENHLNDGRLGEIIRDGFQIVLLGKPNAGKSSLLNVLAKRDAAIVSNIAGTTRDIVSVDMDISGYAVRVTDTAGLREAEDEIEQEGVRRALRAASEADLVICLSEDETGFELPVDVGAGNVLKLITKDDEGQMSEGSISVLTGHGVEALISMIEERLRTRLANMESSLISRARYRLELENTLEHMKTCQSGLNLAHELRSEELRQAGDCIGRITGKIDVEDLLDVIFSEFCVGK